MVGAEHRERRHGPRRGGFRSSAMSGQTQGAACRNGTKSSPDRGRNAGAPIEIPRASHSALIGHSSGQIIVFAVDADWGPCRPKQEPNITETKTITEAEFSHILERHKAYFNRIPGGRRASLKFGNMSGLDLAERCLAEADLSGAKLRHADLRAADLRGANLFGADLTGADLTDAKMQNADLRGATLRDAILVQRTPGTMIGQTGTTTDSGSGSFVGATTQYSLVVSMFTSTPVTSPEKLSVLGGSGFGAYWPAKIWNTFAQAEFATAPAAFPTSPAFTGADWNQVGNESLAPS